MTEVVVPPPRPPTPPRSSSHASKSYDSESLILKRQALVDTPDESPASCPASMDSSSSRSRKRVDFSPWAPPVFTPSSSSKRTVRPLPPSRECKSSTSILKTSSLSNSVSSPQPPPAAHSFSNLTDMLKSIMQQLAVGGRSTSLDAYATLAGTLKAYNDIAEEAKLKDQLQTLCKYIRRDTSQETQETGIPDTNIITSALTVTAILVYTKSFSSLLTDDFRSYLLDRAIQALEFEKTPKAVAIQYIHLLAIQNFRPHIMTKSRASRILDALRTITERVSGNNVQSERHMAYRRFTDQAPTVMKAKDFWLEHLMDGMTSNIPNIRAKALDFGNTASTAFGTSNSVCQSLNKLLDRKQDDGEDYCSHITKRLVKLMGVEGDGQVVPKIWAVIIKLLRGNSIDQFERSKHLKALLIVIQKAFNSQVPEIRASAYHAWNQLTVTVRLSEKTPSSLRKVLLNPMASQLSRSDTGKPLKSNRASAASSYCCLLYYSFRPGASFEQYTILFESYISKFWTESILSIPTNADRACRILMSLLWKDKGKFWTATRVNESPSFEPDDLPRIDCKWVRKNNLQILEVFELLFRKAYWGPEDPDNAFIALAWKSFAKALGEACRKEIIPSSETVETVANILTVLKKIWRSGSKGLNASESTDTNAFLKRYWFLVKSIISEIGIIPFVEPTLVQSDGNSFGPCPDSQLSKNQTATPIVHLLTFLHSTKSGNDQAVDGPFFGTMVEDLLDSLVDPRKEKTSHLHFYRTCLGKLTETVSDVELQISLDWITAATLNLTSKSLDSVNDPVEIVGQHTGAQTDVVELLKLGVSIGNGPSGIWTNILRNIVQLVKTVKGNKTTVTEVFEPLARTLVNNQSKSATSCVAGLVQIFTQAKELWGTSSKLSKLRVKGGSQKTVINESMAKVVDTHLLSCYQSSSVDDMTVVRQMVNAGVSFIMQCPSEQLSSCLASLSTSLDKWLKDPDEQLDSVHDLSMAKRAAARPLWSAVISRLCTTSEDASALSSMEDVFISAFTSSHRDVVNMMIEGWNRSFGSTASLKYPPALSMALNRLRLHVELELPGLEPEDFGKEGSSPPHFKETYNDNEVFVTPDTARAKSPSMGPVIHRIHQRSDTTFSTPVKEVQSKKTKKKKKPTPSLLHNDSQLQFAVIGSSPSEAIESQFMTEHQKEVRDRQRAEPATTFPDLRSSPSRDAEKRRRSESSVLPAVFAEKAVTEPSTPELPQNELGDIDDPVMSSPTPRSSHRDHESCGVDVPSSPLSNKDLQELEGEISTPHRSLKQSLIDANDRLQKSLASEEARTHQAADHVTRSGGNQPPDIDIEMTSVDQSPDPRVLVELSTNLQAQTDNEDQEFKNQPSTPHNEQDPSGLAIITGNRAQNDTLRPKLSTPPLVSSIGSTPFDTPGTSNSQPSRKGRRVGRRSPGDDFDSQIGLQLSQEIEYYADSWETFPDVRDSPEPQNPAQGKVEVSKKRQTRSRKSSRNSSQTSNLPEAIGDTIVVDTSILEDSDSQADLDQVNTTSVELSTEMIVTSASASPVLKRKASEDLDTDELVKLPSPDGRQSSPSKRAKTVSPEPSSQAQKPLSLRIQHATAMDVDSSSTKEEIFGEDVIMQQGDDGDIDTASSKSSNPTETRERESTSNDSTNGDVTQVGAQTEAEIISSLKDVWHKLEQSRISRDGLRNVAELLFEIRSAAEDSVRRVE